MPIFYEGGKVWRTCDENYSRWQLGEQAIFQVNRVEHRQHQALYKQPIGNEQKKIAVFLRPTPSDKNK